MNNQRNSLIKNPFISVLISQSQSLIPSSAQPSSSSPFQSSISKSISPFFQEVYLNQITRTMSQPQTKNKKKSIGRSNPAKSKPQIGWIWPKDPRPGNPTRWSRLKRFSDVLTGKGPDIYVGTIGKHPPARKDKATPGRTVSSTNWARWDSEPKEEDTPFPWAWRGKQEKYDYSTRKYRVPDEKTWSAVEYADCEVECGKWRKKKVVQTTPIRFWDQHGGEHWYPESSTSGECCGQKEDGDFECYRDGDDHCHYHYELFEHDSALGSFEHVDGYPYPIRSPCPGCGM